MEIIKDTHSWALDISINVLINAIKELQNKSLITIGSGGSLAVAQFAAMLHQEYTGNISKHITPLELATMRYPKNVGFMLITSGGRNKDVIQALEILIEKEPKSIIILTASENSPLTKLAKKYEYIRILSFTPPSKKDGFLATNSLYGFCTLLARSYLELYSSEINLLKSLPTFSLKIKNSNSNSFIDFNEAPSFLKDYTISALYSGWSSPAAFDLESKFTEAALGNVQITDYRNFGHGRHNWLDKRGDNTCVLLFISPQCKPLAKMMIEIIPPSIPIIALESDKEELFSSLSFVLGVFELVKIFGDLLEINPGRPKVADFGRKMYHFGLKKCKNKSLHQSYLKNPIHQLGIERKLFNENFIIRDSFDGLFNIYERYIQSYVQDLTNTQFGGLILDYDGTLCELDTRFDKPPENIINEINRLLDSNVLIGIATGRGKSIRETLQPIIPEKKWKQVIVGYYNGGFIGDLSENHIPNKNINCDSNLIRFDEALRNSHFMQFIGEYEVRPYQLTIEPKSNYSLDLLYEILIEFKFRLGLDNISILKSSHSLDILAPNVSKNKIIEYMRTRLEPKINMLPFLSIGDKGKWPGNDFELLNDKYSLSVDECSIDFNSGWNIAPIGHKRTQATFDYLRSLKPKDRGIFTMGINY